MNAVDRSKIFVGMGGWEYGVFNKIFYPPKTAKGFRQLEHYCQFFDNVEANATFYNAAFTPEHAKRWLDEISGNKKFVFTVKLFRGFTHTFDATNDDVRSIRSFLEPLAESGKLGGLVMQFPYSLMNTPEHKKYIRQFSKVFYPHRIFVEVRHVSWNNRSTFEFLQENKLHYVNVDLPSMKRYMPFTTEAWDGAAYFRMMGRNKTLTGHPELDDRSVYFYDKRELGDLYSRIKHVQPVTGSIFTVFHNVADSALINALQLRHRFEQSEHTSRPEDFVSPVMAFRRFADQQVERYPLFAQA